MICLLRYLLIALFIFALPEPGLVTAQKAKTSHRNIEREKKKREKEAQHDYRDALKRHHQNQSKQTKAMMKKSRKESKRNTPVRKK